MGLFSRLRRLANPLKLNFRRPLNPAGVNFRRPLNPLGVNRASLGVRGNVWRRAAGIEAPADKQPIFGAGMSDGPIPDVSFNALGLSENVDFGSLADGPSDSVWSRLGQILGGAASKVIDAKAQAEVIKAQAAIYTPQNIETMRRQAEFESAKAGGLSTGAMVGLGLGALALVMLLKRK